MEGYEKLTYKSIVYGRLFDSFSSITHNGRVPENLDIFAP
jgi:hypothetical protein